VVAKEKMEANRDEGFDYIHSEGTSG
jgi:hypothetical protein